MNLGDLGPARGARKQRKRIGRGPGSGHGKTSTKGHKGHKARSGGGKGPGFEGGQMPLYRRIPKRGFKNPFRRVFAVVNLDDLARCFPQGGPGGGPIGPAELAAAGLVPAGESQLVKVLGGGDLGAGLALTVRAHGFSKTAVTKLEAAGGRGEVIPA
jgi:large subunit ribosomal protein L15